MARRSTYSLDEAKLMHSVGGVNQFVLAAWVEADPSDRVIPVIEHRVGSGSSYHMTYKTRGGAIEGLKRPRTALIDYPSEFNTEGLPVKEIIVYDKIAGDYFNAAGPVDIS